MDANKSIPTELGTEKISKLLKQYALPAIIAQTASSLYNMVDSIFIGHGVGPLAISGLAVTFPLMNLSTAFGTLVGVGASSLMSILLGQRNYNAANKVLGNVVTLNIILGIVFMIVALTFIDPILYFFGASENTLPFAKDYMKIILYGNIITHLYFGLNAAMRSSGSPRKAMGLTIFTVVFNTILDPIFIFVFDMGESIKIDDLARRMIRLAGYVPDKDIMVEYTGLRPGEKLYEEVLANTENTLPTNHSRIRIAKVREYDYQEAKNMVAELERLSRIVDVPSMVRMMKQIVPEFISNNSRYEEFDKK